MSESIKSNFASTLNALVEMQETLLYKFRASDLKSAETAILWLEQQREDDRKRVAALESQLETERIRLDWISRQGDEFAQGILQDCSGDGDYYVYGRGVACGVGKTFRDAIDAARGKK